MRPIGFILSTALAITPFVTRSADAQFLRLRATIQRDSTLPLIVDVFRSSDAVALTEAQVMDTLRSRLTGAGFIVGPIERAWGATPSSFAHLVIDLWEGGGIREDLSISCTVQLSRPGQPGRVFQYSLPRGRARAFPDLRHLGDWLAHHFPDPQALGPGTCRIAGPLG